MIKEINYEIFRLNNVKIEIADAIKTAPAQKLRCATNKGYYQYYCGKEYLGKDKRDYAARIAQKEYCEKLDKKLEQYQKVLSTVQTLYENEELEEIYRSLHPARKALVKPLVQPIEEIIKDFEAIEYEPKGFDKEDMTEYYTIKGERVRSKSEKIIADELYRYQIPYKYEFPLTLATHNRNIQLYPDFTALNKRTGKRWIIEHYGLMDRTSYYENAMQKLDLYEKNNFLLGNNLNLFHETATSPISINVVRKYIKLNLC